MLILHKAISIRSLPSGFRFTGVGGAHLLNGSVLVTSEYCNIESATRSPEMVGN